MTLNEIFKLEHLNSKGILETKLSAIIYTHAFFPFMLPFYAHCKRKIQSPPQRFKFLQVAGQTIRTSTALTPLEPWKYVSDRGSSS